jgi:hypothetical protein
MHIPSAEIYKEMLRETASVWFVPADGSDTHAILLKAPANILKAIIQGCEVSISFAISQSENLPVLVSCVQIDDDKGAPIMVLNPHINSIEHKALPEILNRKSTPLFLYDELSRNIAWSESSWKNCTENISQLISLFQPFYTGSFSKNVESALDSLQISLDPTVIIPSANQINFERVNIVFQGFNAIDIYSYSVNDQAHMFNALSTDEGGGFEQSSWQLAENLFDCQLYKSPQTISSNGKKRELIDIFGFTEKGVFLFEIKVASVLNTSPKRTTERRAKNIEGQINKAIGQLCGAIRVVRKNQKITSNFGVELNFNRQIVPHGVVVISEMMPSIDWERISKTLIEESLESSAMLHIVDLEELKNLIAHSNSIDHFDYYLMQRFEAMVRRENAFMRTRFTE